MSRRAAGVGHRALGRRAAEEAGAARELGVEVDLETVVAALQLGIVRVQQVAGARLRRRQVVGRHRAAGHRVVDRHWRVVRHGQRHVVANDHVLEAAAEILGRHGEAREDFVRHTAVERQLVGTLQVLIEAGQRADTEVGWQGREVDLAAGCQVGAAALALRHIVAVHVGPGQRLRDRPGRVVELREPGRGRRDELVEAAADGGLAVAEDVVDHRRAGRQRVPHRHGDVVIRRRGGEPAALGLLSVDVLLDVVEAEADVDRQLVQLPRILRVEAEVRVEVFLHFERRVEHRHLQRHQVVVDLIEVRVGVVVAAVGTERVLHAQLDVVRAGDVRRRGGHVVAVRVITELLARRVPQVAERVVALADILVPRWRAALGKDAGLIEVVVPFAVIREAALEKESWSDG